MESSSGRQLVTPLPISALPFTDRVSELLVLESLVNHCSNEKKGAVALVLGEAGIGKTRLALRFREIALSKDIRWLSAKCSRADDLAPYSPWVQLLREFVNQASVKLFFKACGPDVEQIVRLIPELVEDNKSTSPAPTAESISTEEEMRQRYLFFQSLTQFFKRLATDSPLVLFFDDLQWGDSATVQLLTYFCRNVLKDQPILLLAACRDFEVMMDQNQSVANFLKDMQKEDVVKLIQLTRFDNAIVQELLANVSKRNDVSREFTSLIHSKTGGNPLFIMEVLRSLFEKRDIFTNDKGQWDRKPISEIEIPSTIVEVIKRRLDRFDIQSRHILRTASVIGEKFDLSLLRKIIGNDYNFSDLDSVVRFAINSGLVERKSAERQSELFSFSDESVHDVLYEEIPKDRLRELHSVVGAALENANRDSIGEVVSELAYHYTQAGNGVKAFEYQIKAGDRASGLYAHEEAAGHYKTALELLTFDGTPENELLRAKLLSQLGEETYRFKGGDSGANYVEEAATIFQRRGEKKIAVNLFSRLVEIYFLAAHDKEKAFEISKKVAVLLAGEPPSFELVYLIGLGSLVYLWAGEGPTALEMWNGAEQMLNAVNDPRMSTLFASARVELLPISDYKSRALIEVERALEEVPKMGDTRMIAYAQFHRAVAWNHTRGPTEKSLQLLMEAQSYALKTGYFDLVFYYKGLICEDYITLGRWENARAIIDELFESLRKFPENPTLYFMANLFRGRLYLLTGELEKSEECLRIASKGGFISPLFAQTPFVDLCKVYLEKGDLVQANSFLEEGLNLSKSKGLTIFTSMRHIEIFSVRSLLDIERKIPLAEAQAHLEEMKEVAKQIDEDWAYAYLHRAEGMLASNQLDFEASFVSFQKSEELWEKLGWPFELAKTRYELARLHYRSGNLLEARKAVEAALDALRKLNAQVNVKKCELLGQELDHIGVAPEFKDVKARNLFNFLSDSFFQDNTVQNLSPESSGWRTLGELAENTGVPTSSLYKKIGGHQGSSPLIRELLLSGCVESKIFLGERGRGGEVNRFRIKYEDPVVRNYVQRLIRIRSERLL
jgi:tetratricopeptide (TPR) repeat protein